jgi:hypothetical protein
MSKTAYTLFVLIYSPDSVGQYGWQAMTRAVAASILSGDYQKCPS